MLRFLAIALVALVAGAGLGRYVLAPAPVVIEKERIIERVVEAPPLPKPPDPEPKRTLRVAMSYAPDLPQFGSLARKLADRVKRSSGGAMALALAAPGQPTPPEQCFDAVIKNQVEACLSTPGLWAARYSALALFGGVPFGPEGVEHIAWMTYGGGEELLDEIYARHELKSVLCGITTAEGGGWFRKPIAAPEDLRGLKLRAYGLAARVYGRTGAEARHLEADKILEALKAGEIDGVEYSFPLIDLGVGFHTLVANYYLPGWQQPTVPLELLFQRKYWEQLPERERALLESACGDSVRDGLAEGEALQAAALRELRAKGVVLHRWPDPVWKALQRAWLDVAEQESEANPAFKKAWGVLSAFRAEYETWRKLGHMP